MQNALIFCASRPEALAGKLSLSFFFAVISIIAYISNCNHNFSVFKKTKEIVSKITCPKIEKGGFVTTMLSYLWNCSENNGPLWRNQTISLCMEV